VGIKNSLGGCFFGARKITYKVYYVDFIEIDNN